MCINFIHRAQSTDITLPLADWYQLAQFKSSHDSHIIQRSRPSVIIDVNPLLQHSGPGLEIKPPCVVS